MKEKIIEKATDMFLRFGFKSVTMDDIAGEMSISKKTIYKYFANKELLISETTETMHKSLHQLIETIIAADYNPIEENFAIRKLMKDIFQNVDTSPLYQLKKHYPEIHETVICNERKECFRFLEQNIVRGIAQGYYRENVNIDASTQFYYILIFNINETVSSEKEAQRLELEILEYHTRAIATPLGITELERNLAQQ